MFQYSSALVHGLNWRITVSPSPCPSPCVRLCPPLLLSGAWKMNLNMSGIHLVTGAFIVNKIIHLLCPVVFSRQCIDLWIAIQKGARSSSVRGTERCLWRLWMWCVMMETNLAHWPYCIIQIICQHFIESVITRNRFSGPGASYTECYQDQTMLGWCMGDSLPKCICEELDEVT